jgi:hypothetical protein
MRLLPLAAATAATAVLALAGCQPSSGTASATASASTSATAIATASASAPASGGATGACNPDYCDPADWDTGRASTPLTEIPPFVEPVNVVISARSTVPLTALQAALKNWDTVATTTDVNVFGIHLKCISSETADVTGHGYLPQHVAWRLNGCLGGNVLSLTGDEDHVRIWNQPVPGSKSGAWFIAASYETMCVVRDGRLQTADANKTYAALHAGDTYHCVDGGPGSIHAKHPDGYDDGAAALVDAVTAAAKSHHWQVSQRTVTVSRNAHSGEGGVPFSGTVSVLTVTK